MTVCGRMKVIPFLTLVQVILVRPVKEMAGMYGKNA
jgi:hypothetical protein